MKIFIYIVFFLIFLIIFAVLIGLLIRSISFFISSVKYLKFKFTATATSTSDSVQLEPIVSVADEKPIEMDTINIEK